MSEARKKLRKKEIEVEEKRKLGLTHAIMISRRHAGYLGTAKIRDELGRERWVTRKDYYMMRDAGRKITLLEEKMPEHHSAEDEPLSGMASIEEIQRKEQEVNEKIKRKKEELRLKREEKLVKFRRDIRHMIDDENTGIGWYRQLIQQAEELRRIGDATTGITYRFAENVRDLQRILNDEQIHLSLLKSMMETWITHKR